MTDAQSESWICPICGESRSPLEKILGETVPEKMVHNLQSRSPGWTPLEEVCESCVQEALEAYLVKILDREFGPLSLVEREVAERVSKERLVSLNTAESYERTRTPTEAHADRVVELVGSWGFAGAILIGLLVWILVNILIRPMGQNPLFPVALVGAVLASLAAIQGPIILMSQRNQAHRDRLRAENDYRVNLKAELEIQYVVEKVDHMLKKQARMHDEIHEQLQRQNRILAEVQKKYG